MQSTIRPAEVSPLCSATRHFLEGLQVYSLLSGRCSCTTFISKGLELTLDTETCSIFGLFQVSVKFNHWDSPGFYLKQQNGSHTAQQAGSRTLLWVSLYCRGWRCIWASSTWVQPAMQPQSPVMNNSSPAFQAPRLRSSLCCCSINAEVTESVEILMS